jgi:hypothetical protein
VFDMTGRAKWDAWTSAGKIWGQGREGEAEQRYLDIARGLGWVEGAASAKGKEVQIEGNNGDIWDDEADEDHVSWRGGGGDGGMGITVSTLAAQPLDEKERETMHGLAVTNDLDALVSFLQNHPEADINAFDEFVRFFCRASWQLHRANVLWTRVIRLCILPPIEDT